MELRKNNYEIEIQKNDMKVFEERMLFSGLCDFIVPMRFTEKADKKKITYNCNGYVSLRDMMPLSPNKLFEILEKTLLTLNKSVEFFIPHNKVTLSVDTVYYDNKKKKVRIAYIPARKGELNKNLNSFLDELVQSADDEAKEYLISVKGDLNKFNRSLRDMAAFISEQRKRINQCMM